MRRGLVIGTAALAIGAVAAGLSTAGVAASPHLRVTVSPRTGHPTTTFVVTFRSPDRTGRSGVVERRDTLSVRGPRGTACVASATEQLPLSRLHALVRAKLEPSAFGGTWCLGTFHGRIDELAGPYCGKGAPCPEFATRVTTIGRFAFTVRALAPTGGGTTTTTTTPTTTTPPPGIDRTPPVFAGIESASACTPGPQKPGETTPFTLTWMAATDNVTPSSQIVYDVYESTTAGAENFSTPTWTTPAGATIFRTPGLPSHGTFYFVVRARDQAGNEDRNTVEVRGSDPCV